MVYRLSVLLLLTLVQATTAARARITRHQEEVQAKGFIYGYLTQTGSEYYTQWTDSPVEDAIAQVRPAATLRQWEIGARRVLQRAVTQPANMLIGWKNFFMLCRKKGLTVTLLRDDVNIVLFNAGEPITLVELGKGFNVHDFAFVGVLPGGPLKVKDLLDASAPQFGVFANAVQVSDGIVINLDPYEKNEVLTVPYQDDALMEGTVGNAAPSDSDVKESTAMDASTVSVPQEVVGADDEGPIEGLPAGCYLVLNTDLEGVFQLRTRYSTTPLAGAVAFFEPSQSKVPLTSWKYKTGNEVTVYSDTMSQTGVKKPYYQRWSSFINECYKQKGKFTVLKMGDGRDMFKTKVYYMEKESIVPVRVNIGEAIDLDLDADNLLLIAILPDSIKDLDVPTTSRSHFSFVANEKGFLISLGDS